MPKTCHVAVSKPNTNSLWSLGTYHGKASGTPSQAAAEGFDVQRPWKGAAGVLRLLRGAQNVPRSSFEAQRKRLVRPREYHGKAGGPKACHVAASKPNANSLWGLGRYHGKGQSRHRALPHTYGDPGRRPA